MTVIVPRRRSLRRSRCSWCDHGVRAVLDNPVHGAEHASFGRLITELRRAGADPVRKGQPWSLPLEARLLLVTAYWRTNLTLRQIVPLFCISKPTADRIIDPRTRPLEAILPVTPRSR